MKEQASTHSISERIREVCRGSEDAMQYLFERYLDRLIGLAYKKLQSMPRKAADEEDIVMLAFEQFFRQAQQGRFPQLDDRHDLWQVLAMLVDRRAKDWIRQMHAQKAGGMRVRTESVFQPDGHPSMNAGMDQLEDFAPSPKSEIEIIEFLDHRLTRLDEKYREIVLLKLEGCTNAVIANRLGYSTRTVERRLDYIRQLWGSDTADEHQP